MLKLPVLSSDDMGKKFKEPKPLPVTKSKQNCLSIPPGGIIAGFPEFWQKAYRRYPRFFDATDQLVPLVNTVLARPVGGKLPVLFHFMTGIISNSLGSLITLALNGYGHDAVRIARGMFEMAVNVAYLAKHPDEADDYIDYNWIRQKKLMTHLEKADPEMFAKLTQAQRDEINAGYARALPRFQTKSGGKPRSNWCVKNIRERAEEVGVGGIYPTFYAYASAIHHGDIAGLSAQISTGKFQTDLAPSFQAMGDALYMGHQSVLVVIDNFNDVADFGMETEIEAAVDAFHRAWNTK